MNVGLHCSKRMELKRKRGGKRESRSEGEGKEGGKNEGIKHLY